MWPTPHVRSIPVMWPIETHLISPIPVMWLASLVLSIPVMWPTLLVRSIPVVWPIATHIAPSIPVMWPTPMFLGTLHPRVSSWGNPVSPHPNSTQQYRCHLLLVHPRCPAPTFWLGTLLLRVMPRSFAVRPQHPVLLILVMQPTWIPLWLGTLLLRVMPRSFAVRPRHPVLSILVMLPTY